MPKTCRASRGFFYAIWLYNSPHQREAVSKSPAVGSSHKLAGGALLPTNAGEYHDNPAHPRDHRPPDPPGHVVLRGAFNLTE